MLSDKAYCYINTLKIPILCNVFPLRNLGIIPIINGTTE